MDVLEDVLHTARFTNNVYRRLELSAPWGIRLPDREHASFYVVARGGGWLEVAGEPPLTLSAGDVALMPRGGAHTFKDSPRSRPASLIEPGSLNRAEPLRQGGSGPTTSLVAGCFQLDPGAAGPFLSALPRVVHFPAADPASAPWLGATVQLIVSESAGPGLASRVVLSRLADVLLVQALRALGGRPSCQARRVQALSDPAVGKALALMHARLTEPWTVEGLASTVGLSRSAFAARFHELVGEPPLQYLSRWRMVKAGQLLGDSDHPLVEVAARVGYTSGPAFNKAFKRWAGQGPGAYRRTRRTGPPARGSGARG
jgi:AraC-like DNA-binding protein